MMLVNSSRGGRKGIDSITQFVEWPSGSFSACLCSETPSAVGTVKLLDATLMGFGVLDAEDGLDVAETCKKGGMEAVVLPTFA